MHGSNCDVIISGGGGSIVRAQTVSFFSVEFLFQDEVLQTVIIFIFNDLFTLV